MTLAEALDIVVARTGHARYRELCADGHPARERYIPVVLRMAGEPVPEPQLPPLASMAGNALGAPAKASGCGCGRPAAAEPPLPPLATMAANYARAMALHALDGFASVDPATYEARLAACLAPCPLYRPSDHRCSGCGCPVAEAAKIRTKPRPEGCRWPA